MNRLHSRLRMRNGAGWNQQMLFANGEQGVIYDPSDLNSLFQDSAGTVPVTAAGQPVGLMLDKSKGVMRGAELLTNKTPIGPSVTRNIVLAPNALNKAYEIINAAGLSWHDNVSVVAITTNRVIVMPRTAGGGLLNLYNATGSAVDVSAVSVRELHGNHAFQSTAASRPILRLNATTGAYYLETDGVDDFMSTAAIDFTATDKVSVFAGVRKLSDAATGMLAELSNAVGGNSGTFYMAAPVATDRYQIASNGSIVVTAGINNAAYNAPQSVVMFGSSNISGDLLTLRINSIQVAQTTANQGTGNYGNYPLYLFRRGGTTLPFNGYFYGLTIVGRLASATEITNIERIYANKTGVTLA